jgi:predicted ester cyclase
MTADLDRNKDLVRRWIEFSNTGFEGSLDDFISTDYIGHLGARTMDRSELERLERQFCVAFPDARHAIDDLIAEGDKVVLRTTARANAPRAL